MLKVDILDAVDVNVLDALDVDGIDVLTVMELSTMSMISHHKIHARKRALESRILCKRVAMVRGWEGKENVSLKSLTDRE